MADKLQIECTNVLVARAGSSSFDWLTRREPRWYALIALELVDTTGSKRQKISPEFCILVCSPNCLEKPLRSMPTRDKRYIVTQDKLDMSMAKKIAQERMKSIHAHTMDDFYNQMRSKFLTFNKV